MSGGAYEYAYRRVEDMADGLRSAGGCHCATPAMRELFREHLRRVAKAMRAVEWNDSGDGDEQEAHLIWECLNLPPATLAGALAQQKVAAIKAILREGDEQ